MKKLVLIRHAKSAWENTEISDHQRPLNKRGRNDAPEMGRRLKKLGIIPDTIYLSDSKRTKETMSLLVPAAEWDDIEMKETEDLYLATLYDYIQLVEILSDEHDIVCICGHNPTVTDIINFYTSDHLIEIPTCSLAILEFDLDSWKFIKHKSGRLTTFDYPKNVD